MRRTALVAFLFLWVFNAAAQQKKQIGFEQLFDHSFSPQAVRNINWMRDGQYYTTLHRDEKSVELRKYDITDGSYEVLLKQSQLVPAGQDSPIAIYDYQFSADEQQLLIETDVEQIWRRSTKANYYVYKLSSGQLQKLTDTPGKQQYAQFSPAGDRVAFVRDNNLFYVDLNTGEEIRITDDGAFNKIINGASDWVYEEEFSFAKAWFWSPDGNRIAFYRFDESRVKQYQFPEYGGQYPDQVVYKYPKAGEENSIVKIGVYDISSGKTHWMDIGQEKDQYIVRVNWTNDPDQLAIRRMNRLQNKQDLMLADAASGESTVIKTETSNTWIDENDDLTFLDNGKQFIYVSEEDGYNHIYLYNIDGSLVRQVTRGDWEVTQ